VNIMNIIIKYRNLLLKEILINKRVIFLDSFIVFCMIIIFFCYPKYLNMGISQLAAALTYPLAIIFVYCKMLEDKFKGMEFLTTTSYTRRNIVISRFIFWFLSSMFIFLINYISTSITLRRSVLNFVEVLFLFFIILFFLSVSLLLSFLLKSVSFSAICLLFAELPALFLFYAERIRSISNNALLAIVLVITSVFLIILSISCSIKVFEKRDL